MIEFMAQYIDKSALVAEIERRKKYYENIQMIKPVYESNIEDFNELLSFLNTIEAKEADLEKEIELVKGDYEQVDVAWNNDFDFIARHFFELGCKTNNTSNSFEATVCKVGNTYLKEMDKDAIAKALEPYKDGDKVKVIIIKDE